MRTFLRDVRDIEWLLECEIESRLGWNFYLLALGKDLHAGSCTRSDPCADCGAFAAARESANQCAEHCAATDCCGAAFSARGTRLLHVGSTDVVGSALEDDALNVEREFAAAFDLARRTGVDELDVHVGAFRYDHAIVNDNWRVQRCFENLPRRIHLRVHTVNHAHCNG